MRCPGPVVAVTQLIQAAAADPDEASGHPEGGFICDFFLARYKTVAADDLIVFVAQAKSLSCDVGFHIPKQDAAIMVGGI